MLWPTPADYAQAVGGYPDVCMLDPKLKGGKPKKKKTLANKLILYTGGFSTVFPIETAHNDYALRCWNKDIGDSKNRYEKIDNYLKQVQLPYFVDFEYVTEGILINGKKWPITRMEWAKGESLRAFIEHNLHDSKIFNVVADEFRKMFETLHATQISHGDLQSGNIMLGKNGTDIIIKLIDYDSLFVPDLRGQKSPTPGLPEYQHPSRIDKCDEKMDYFSELVIYLSFLSLSEKPELWNQFKDKTEKGLLFSRKDFENPDQSAVLQELENLSPEIQQLTANLKDFCAKASIDELEPLEAILPTAKHDEKYYTDRGFDQQKRNRYIEAISEFQKAIAINSNYGEAHYGLGLSYLHSNKYNEAIKTFEQVTYKDPNYKEAFYALGLSYFKSGDNSKAIAPLNKVLKIDPLYQPAKQLLDAIKNPPIPPDPPSPDPDIDVSPSNNKKSTNHWQHIATGFLAVGLIVCLIVILTQMNAKDNALAQHNGLKSQVTQKETQIQELNTSIQSLNSDNESLNTENNEQKNKIRKLENQLAEKDKEIQQLTSKIRILENTKGMVLIPAGEFRMGSNAIGVAFPDEKPEHKVYVDAFYIDKYEVTNKEYKTFIDANPQWGKNRIYRGYHDGDYLKHWTGNNYPIGMGDHPVVWVSWHAAMAYAKWKGKRLPTEAEWEKAARGGLSRLNYPMSNKLNSGDANYGQIVGGTMSVGNYLANFYGLYDMAGNVSEWCLDKYDKNIYATSPSRNPVAGGSIYSIVRDFKNHKTARVLRGGSWSSHERNVRVSYRNSYIPKITLRNVGFRCVKPVTP